MQIRMSPFSGCTKILDLFIYLFYLWCRLLVRLRKKTTFRLGPVPRRCKVRLCQFMSNKKIQRNAPTLNKTKQNKKKRCTTSSILPSCPKKHLSSFARSEFLSISVGLQAELGEETVLGVCGADPDVVSSNNQRLKWSSQYSGASQVWFYSLMSGFKWSEARGCWWLVWICPPQGVTGREIGLWYTKTKAKNSCFLKKDVPFKLFEAHI